MKIDLEHERAIRQGQRERLAELADLEERCRATLETITWQSSPATIFEAEGKLAAIARIRAAFPPPEVLVDSSVVGQVERQNQRQVVELGARIRDAREEIVRINQHELPSIKRQLAQPLDTRLVKPAYAPPGTNSYDAQARENQAVEQARAVQFGAQRQRQRNLLNRIEELKRQIAADEETLRQLRAASGAGEP
ncbi:MAG: hypothetical protein ACJ74W_10370 [Pyrinomonadaceae bacterium]